MNKKNMNVEQKWVLWAVIGLLILVVCWFL